MLFPPRGAEQLLGKELLCSSFHQRKCQRSKLCCQMPHGHQMFPTGSPSPCCCKGRAPALAFLPEPALSSLSCCRPICPTLGSSQASDREDRCWGGGGTLGPPLSLSPFPASCMALLFGAITSWLHKNSNLWQKDTALGFHCK